MISWAELSKHDRPEDLWIAIQGKAYDVTGWGEIHPGGLLVLTVLGGRDATQQFNAYHPNWVWARLKSFYIGQMEFQAVAANKAEIEFAELKEKVEAAGLMQPAEKDVYPILVLIIGLFVLTVQLVSTGYLVVSALCLALCWQQAAFLGHDLGHSAISDSKAVHNVLGLVVNTILGIGMSWWKSTHNVHHTVVNTADSDPDIQFMPLLAVSDHFFEPVWSRYHQGEFTFDQSAKFLISWQHITFFPLLMIAKFGLYIQTIKQLLYGKSFISRPLEVIAQLLFFTWYGCIVVCFEGWKNRLAFVLLSHAAFFVLHLQICLSHFACPTTGNLDENASTWMAHQVEGTMNWSCPPCLDWIMGGLQFQIEHHLFPRMPRQNLRKASAFVQASCRRCGLKYHCPTFFGAISETVQVLHAAAKNARKRQCNSLSSCGKGTQQILLPRIYI